jgi:hypothetical protein
MKCLMILERNQGQLIDCHFSRPKLLKQYTPFIMDVYLVDVSYPLPTHFSIPWLLLWYLYGDIYYICVCLFWKATLNLLGQSEGLYTKKLIVVCRPSWILSFPIQYLLIYYS